MVFDQPALLVLNFPSEFHLSEFSSIMSSYTSIPPEASPMTSRSSTPSCSGDSLSDQHQKPPFPSILLLFVAV